MRGGCSRRWCGRHGNGGPEIASLSVSRTDRIVAAMPVAHRAPGAAERYETDVCVVGGGVAGLCAAVAAREAGADVILLEKAPRDRRGGNTRFADAQMRFPHEADEYGPRDYTVDQMYSDLMRISQGRANPELVRTLCEHARETAEWLTEM